jgi:hypothetical protein
MTAFLAISLIATLTVMLVRWVAAVPLMRTLTASIDSWADGVQGQDSETRR